MFKDLPPLNSLLAFEASARLNSFKSAADELHQTPAAIAYQIKKLEDTLGLQLFTRHHKGVQLNQIGESYYSSIQTILKQLQTETQNLKRTQAKSTLKILTLHAIAERWLMPRLKQFRQLYPVINIEISAKDKIEMSDEADIIIGFSHRRPTQADTAILMQEEIFPVCSPNYPVADPIKPENLTDYDLMIDAHWRKDWDYWLQQNKSNITLKLQHSLSFSLYNMVIDAAIKGMGIMMGHKQLILPELENNALIRVFADSKSATGYYTLTTHRTPITQQKIEFFTDWLHQQAT